MLGVPAGFVPALSASAAACNSAAAENRPLVDVARPAFQSRAASPIRPNAVIVSAITTPAGTIIH